MSKSIRGTTASHKSGGFDVISNFRGNNKALVPKKDSLLANLSLLCIVHSSCERRTRGQIIVEKLKDKGISMTNTMFVDTNNTYAREMHRNCLIELGAKNGHVPPNKSKLGMSATSSAFIEDLIQAMRMRVTAGAERLVVFSHSDNIHDIVFHFDKRIEKEAWNNGFRYFTDEKKDQDMLVVEYGPKPNIYLK
jgi:hypothetical protein